MLSNCANSTTGTRVDKMIIKPPMVGVPAFSACPSNPKSLMVSPICLRCRNKMIRFPYMVEMAKESKIAIAALNVVN